MANDLKQHEALIYIMVIMSAADADMRDTELRMMGEIIKTWPVFAGFAPANVLPTAQKCTKWLKKDDGIDQVLDIVFASLPARLRDTAYALAVEIAVADRDVQLEELRLLQILRDRLAISKLSVAAIEHSAHVRCRS